MNDAIVMRPESANELRVRLDKILELMNLERMHAHTHSQRNAYQAVIRHEIEVLKSEVRSNYSTDGKDDIPF